MKTRFQISIQPVPSGVGSSPNVEGVALAVAGEEVDLGARTARAGVAHLPEVVAGHAGDADDAVVAEAGDLLPDRARLVVGAAMPSSPPKTVTTRRFCGDAATPS